MSSLIDRGFTLEDNVLKGIETRADLISYNIGEFLLNAFNKNPNHVSQIDAKTNVGTTYAEMKDRVVRCAIWLEKQGLGCDDIVALYTYSQLDADIPIFATYLAQAIISPWRYDLSLDNVRRWLELFRPKLIFVSTDAVDILDEAMALERTPAKIVVFGEHPKYQSLSEIIESESSDDVGKYIPRTVKSPHEVAITIVSSGTTNFPKAAMLSSETLLRNAFDYNFSFKDKNVWWYSTPADVGYHTMVFASIFQNATRIIFNKPDAKDLCTIVEKFQVNYAHVHPKILNSLVRFKEIDEYNMECLEAMRTGGEKVNRVTFNKLKSSCLRDKIYQGYGSSEIGSGRILPKLGNQKSHHSVGFVTSNLQVKIIDRVTMKTLGANAVGEILIKSPTLMLGYYGKPELTKSVIDDEGWYHSGDVGYYYETGEVFFMGRITDSFKYRGQEIFTCEIEDILWEHQAVMEVAVVSVPREPVGEIPVAFVKIVTGKNVTKEELVDLLKTFEKCKTLPLNVQFVGEILLNHHRKVAKTYLRQLALTLTD